MGVPSAFAVKFAASIESGLAADPIATPERFIVGPVAVPAV